MKIRWLTQRLMVIQKMMLIKVDLYLFGFEGKDEGVKYAVTAGVFPYDKCSAKP